MDDRCVLVGGPFNDLCLSCSTIGEVLLIEMPDDEGIVHLYSLDPDLADCSIYKYTGVRP